MEREWRVLNKWTRPMTPLLPHREIGSAAVQREAEELEALEVEVE
jgi:hypothetical protein